MGGKAGGAAGTKVRLVAVARELFAERGYEGTSLEGILSRAEVSKGALYHHFVDKRALFEAVYCAVAEDVLARVAEAAASARDPIAMLRAGSNAWLDLVTSNHAVRRIALIDGPAVLGWHRWRDLDERYGFGVVKHVLQVAIDGGAIRPQPVDMLAHTVLAVLGEVAMVVVRSDAPDAARVDALTLIDRLIEGMTVGARQRRR